MEELLNLKNKLAAQRPVSWSELPDISLYKDQVVSYMLRQTIDSAGDGKITSAMVSNYVKDKLLPKPEGKKYTREHLAGLTEISLLKQVLSVGDTGLLLSIKNEKENPEGFYGEFADILDKALNETAEKIDPQWETGALRDMALQFAIDSYCCRLACVELLGIIRSKAENGRPKTENGKAKAENGRPKTEKREG